MLRSRLSSSRVPLVLASGCRATVAHGLLHHNATSLVHSDGRGHPGPELVAKPARTCDFPTDGSTSSPSLPQPQPRRSSSSAGGVSASRPSAKATLHGSLSPSAVSDERAKAGRQKGGDAVAGLVVALMMTAHIFYMQRRRVWASCRASESLDELGSSPSLDNGLLPRFLRSSIANSLPFIDLATTLSSSRSGPFRYCVHRSGHLFSSPLGRF